MESTDGNSCLIGDPAGAAHAADLMKALAHPLRLQLIALLSATPLHVADRHRHGPRRVPSLEVPA